MPLTTYTAGEVLTASSLNANFSFAASAGALKYLTGGSFTSVAAVNLAANTFTATYRNYLININITASSDGVALNWRGRTSGTDNSLSLIHI